ncbi:MAG: DUF1631 domain-containing protein, partial [Burkholderiaceae bacterium]|nr:DUF1631 domain-containing protein [Burkholderiaceae bacterium]
MTQIDRRITQPAIDAALDLIGEAAATAVDDTAKRLDTLANVTATTYVAERDAIVSAQRDLSHQLPLFHRAFNDGLRKKVMLEFSPRHERRQPQPSTTWESLSLVEDTALEERMFSDRLGRGIEDASEWELRELARYTAALLPPGETGKDPNPFRPEVLGAALYSAIEAVSTELECRKLLAREMGPVVAKHMRSCYSEIVADLKSRGVQPVQLGLRGVDGSGNDRTATGFGSQVGDLRNAKGGDHNEQLDTGSPASSGWMRGARFDSSGLGSMPRGGSNASSASAWVNRPYATGGTDGSGSEPAVVDAELMSLIRRLAVVSGHAGDAADAETRSASIFGASSGGDSGAGLALGTGDLRGDGLTGTVAVNLIRAHRDELRRASNGTIEHMVIDVVASLFDQILSDSRVAPQMARQIGRLQLPVLRVALSDSSFFSTRKHPVRRFVNRLASLASAFEDFNDGPGKKFLERVSALVQEIIDGDFDQVDVYTDKLNLLEGFIERQIQSDVQANGAATLLDGKESELLAQQRYMQQLRAALAPLEVPDYLRDFLSQVWSQTLVFANRRDGPMAERTVRMRRAACDLVMSVQPKDTSALRKAFLMGLPRLMRDLTDGLKLIGWPEAAQKEFFARLLPAHSEALRNKGQSELDRNLLAKQLEAVFNAPVPSGAQHVPVGA